MKRAITGDERRRMRCKSLVDPAVAVKELLRGFKRCAVQLGRTLNQAETHTKLSVKRLGIVTHYFEPAAFRRAFRAKRANNNVTTRSDAARNLPDIGSPLVWRGKKMKYRSVMPEVVRSWFQFDLGNISDNPTHLVGGRTQSTFRDIDCGLRDI